MQTLLSYLERFVPLEPASPARSTIDSDLAVGWRHPPQSLAHGACSRTPKPIFLDVEKGKKFLNAMPYVLEVEIHHEQEVVVAGQRNKISVL